MQYSKRAFELTIQRIGQRVLDQVRLEFSREANGLIREEVGKIFEESDAIESMRTGDLKSELGLTRANEKTERLINAIKRSFVSRRRLVLSNANRNRNSLFRINGIPTDYSFLLDSAFAVQLTKKGQRLPWLDWLLLQGRARPIVRDYKISRRARGRSRLPGIMVKGRPGWRPRPGARGP